MRTLALDAVEPTAAGPALDRAQANSASPALLLSASLCPGGAAIPEPPDGPAAVAGARATVDGVGTLPCGACQARPDTVISLMLPMQSLPPDVWRSASAAAGEAAANVVGCVPAKRVEKRGIPSVATIPICGGGDNPPRDRLSSGEEFCLWEGDRERAGAAVEGESAGSSVCAEPQLCSCVEPGELPMLVEVAGCETADARTSAAHIAATSRCVMSSTLLIAPGAALAPSTSVRLAPAGVRSRERRLLFLAQLSLGDWLPCAAGRPGSRLSPGAFSGGARSHRESATEKEAEGGKQGAHQKNRAAPKEWKGRGRGAEEEREREESRNRGRETEGCVKRQESEGGGREGREKRERMGGRERGADASPARGNRSAPLFPSRGVSINST
eukprot:scaffold179822_cov31-Tisochrysis_lutea.AAC.15